MKTILLFSAVLFLSACNSAPKTLAEKCAGYVEEYRENNTIIDNNRTGNTLQRTDADRRFALNLAIKDNAESDKCDTSKWPALSERPV